MARTDDSCVTTAFWYGETRTLTAISVRAFVINSIDGPMHLYRPPRRVARKVSEGR